MSAKSEEAFRQKVRAIFAECFGSAAATRLDLAVDEAFNAAVVRAYPELDAEHGFDLGFHLSDWRSDGAFLLALSLTPDRFTPEEIRQGLDAYLVHAPNHIVAAAKLAGWPVQDIFDVGALDAAFERGPDHDPAS